MSPATPSELVSALHRFGLERDRLRTALARALGIGPTDLLALEHLEERGTMSQRSLGDRLLLSSGAVTMLVDRLERAGLVARVPNPSDRRSTLLELTAPEAGAADPLGAYHADVAAAAGRVPASARGALTAFLHVVAVEAARAVDALTET